MSSVVSSANAATVVALLVGKSDLKSKYKSDPIALLCNTRLDSMEVSIFMLMLNEKMPVTSLVL